LTNFVSRVYGKNPFFAKLFERKNTTLIVYQNQEDPVIATIK
jgi:hypothetical protein